MRDVLFVSKPIAPPWNDSNKNLVRDVAGSLRRYRARVMVPRGVSIPGVTAEPLYATAGTYAPSRFANARVLARLAFGSRAHIWHFFFGPNPLTLRAGRLAVSLRRARTVHTIASAPDDLERVAPLLFADRVVALSRHTARRLERAGVNATVIPPAVARVAATPGSIASARERHALPPRFVLYPGDLEFGDGAATFVRAAARDPSRGWVIASRPKTPRAHEARRLLEAGASAAGARMVWLAEIDDIHAVVAAADAVVLVTNTLHAKMDWPLVLLEALVLRVPALVACGTPADEMCASGAVEAIPAGDADAIVAALARGSERSEAVRRESNEQAAKWVEATCGATAVAEAYEALYDTLES